MDYDNGTPAQVVLVSGKIELSNSDNETVVMNRANWLTSTILH